MKHKTIKKHKLIFLLILGAILVLAVSIAVFINTRGLTRLSAVNFISKDGTAIEFDEEFSLPVGREVILDDDGESVSIKVTHLDSPDINEEPSHCDNLKINQGACPGPKDIFRMSVEIAGHTFTSNLTHLTLDESADPYEQEVMEMTSDTDEDTNSWYNIFPYEIRMTAGDLPNYATLMISRVSDYSRVEMGEVFTLRSDALVELEPAKTGFKFFVGDGYDAQIDEIYINRMEIGGNLRLMKQGLGKVEDGSYYIDTREDRRDSKLISGDIIGDDSTRLRVVETDGETYATFVFERAN